MYVCVCNALKEKQVEEAINDDCKTTDEIFEYYDCEVNCGLCIHEMKEMLDQNGE